MSKSISNQFENAEPIERPTPLPLRRKTNPAQPYPITALGPVLADAAKAIMEKVQCPNAIAGQCVLGVAALATQAHANVIHPATGEQSPLSLFLVTVASSGERKSTADKIALEPVRLREHELHEQYEKDFRVFKDKHDAYQRARETILKSAKGKPADVEKQLATLGAPPRAPLEPLLTVPDPTLEGLHKLMAVGEPSMGLFSDEAGTFIGGYGMSDDSRLRTAAGLSHFWDGKPVKRVRGGDGVTLLRGRRLSVHLMVQPGIDEGLLADPTLQKQGLVSRLLISAPASRAGTRRFKPHKTKLEPALKRYQTTMLNLLRQKQHRVGGSDPALNPRSLPLSAKARKEWVAFYDECEGDLATGGRFEPIRPFASKLPEHALRIAGVLTLIDDANAKEVSVDAVSRAIDLARYYANEALRLQERGVYSAELENAEKLLKWLHEKGKTLVAPGQICQYGPNAIRVIRSARQALQVLEEHHWVTRLPEGATIDGKRYREVWEVVQP